MFSNNPLIKYIFFKDFVRFQCDLLGIEVVCGQVIIKLLYQLIVIHSFVNFFLLKSNLSFNLKKSDKKIIDSIKIQKFC